MQNLDDSKVSYYRNTRARRGNVLCLDEVAISRIFDGDDGISGKTQQCRTLASTDPEGYKKFKSSQLPAVTFSGVFSTRTKSVPLAERWQSHSGLIVLDFDGVDVGTVLAEVTQIPTTILAFVSPSGSGVKVVVSVSPVPKMSIKEHKAAWRAVVEAYSHIGVADPSGSDPTRLCFLTHDPQVFYEALGRQSVEWEIDESEPEPIATRYTGEVDITALDFISSDDYDTWLKTGMACHAAGVPFEVWHEWSQKSEKHEPCTCAGTWNSFSLPSTRKGEKSITWGFVVTKARENGMKPNSTGKHKNTAQSTESSEPREANAPESVGVDAVQQRIKEFFVRDFASEDDRSNGRSEIFDLLAALSPSDLESMIPLVKQCLDVSVSVIRREVKNRHLLSPLPVVTSELPTCPERADDDKPYIWITEPDGFPKEQGVLANEVFEILVTENSDEPFIFDSDGWVVVKDGTERISIVDSDDFRTTLADRFHWWRVTNSEKKGIQHFPVNEVPAYISKSVERHRYRHVKIPKLERVVNRPLLQHDGTFATRRGYVADLKSFILSDFQIEKMPLEKARKVLTEPFSLFPYADPKDRATAFAYLFTLLLRERLGAHVPYFHFGAARQGTGKGLLCRSMFYIVEGREIAHAAYYRDEERLIRSVSSFLLGGAPGILFDNVLDGFLVSNPFLEMISTAPIVSLRVLYQTIEREVPVNSVMAFTGNNLSFDSGLRRRVQHCYLESELERPELRAETEDLPDLKKLVRGERLSLLSAALSIIREWVTSGCPEANINLGSYETWGNIIAEVLNIAGINSFQPVAREMSDRDIARRVFIKTVWEKFATGEWGAKETLLIAADGDENNNTGRGILSEFFTGDKRNYAVRLGHILRTFANQVFQYENGLFLQVTRVDGVSPVKYRITKLAVEDSDKNYGSDPDSEVGF